MIGHTEELEIKRDELVGVQWKIRKREDVLTKNEVPPHIILCTLPKIDLCFATKIYGKKVRVPVVLETRPIYHQRDETIRGHVFCSFLALVLRKELHSRLEEAGFGFEWAD